MVMARRNMMVGGAKMPTARDYLDDGCTAVYDSIENIGLGKYKDGLSSGYWKNLAGGNDLFVTGNVSITDKVLSCKSSNQSSSTGYVYSDNNTSAIPWGDGVEWTLEFVIKTSGDYGTLFTLGFGQNCIRSYGENRIAINTTKGIAIPTGIISVSIPYVGRSDQGYAYVNGERVNTTTPGYVGYAYSNRKLSAFIATSNDKGTIADLYAIRAYIGIRDHEDVNRRYAIDKARFGLT